MKSACFADLVGDQLLNARCDAYDLAFDVGLSPGDDEPDEAAVLARTTVHEAGHALISAVEGKPFYSVENLPNKRGLGACWEWGPGMPLPAPPSLATWVADVRVSLAGPIAEEMIFGDAGSGYEGDLFDVAQVASRFGGAGWQRGVWREARKVRRKLARRLRVLHRLTQALAERRSMLAADVMAVCGLPVARYAARVRQLSHHR